MSNKDKNTPDWRDLLFLLLIIGALLALFPESCKKTLNTLPKQVDLRATPSWR